MANVLTGGAALYGSDSYALTDLQRVSQQVTDPQTLVALRVARRLQTPRGALALLNGDANCGLDVRTFVNAKQTPGWQGATQQQVQAECLKDEEVLGCSVQVSPIAGSQRAISIAITLQLSEGPFPLTLIVSALTVQVLMPTQGAI
jgi:hypothetical protein